MRAGIGLVALVAATLAASGLRASEAYVDGCSPFGFGNGTSLFPYHKLWQALELTATNDDVYLEHGSYPERRVLDEPVILHASGGPVLIGAHYVGVSEVCVPLIFESDWERDGLVQFLVDCGGELGVMARVYWPSRDPAGQAFACPAPFPVVLHAHGDRHTEHLTCTWSPPQPLEQDYRQAGTILSGLAAIGVLAISIDVSMLDSSFQKGDFLLNALAYVRNQSFAGGWLEDQVDLDRVALSGHSTGGAGAVRAANDIQGTLATTLGVSSIPIQALGLLATLRDVAPTGDMPVLVIHSGNEHAQQVAHAPILMYRDAPGPRHLVTIAGANHFGYTDEICLPPGGCGFSDTASLVGGAADARAHRLQRTAARLYYQRFFSSYLLDDPFGEECALLQGSVETCDDPSNGLSDCNDDPMVPAPDCGSPACQVPQLSGLGVGVTVCSCVP